MTCDDAIREWLCSDEALYIGSMDGDQLDALAARLAAMAVDDYHNREQMDA